MKDYKFNFEVEGKNYELMFNLNVMQEIQEEYGTIEEWGKLTDSAGGKEPNAKALIFGLTAMMNEVIEINNDEKGTNEPLLTKKQVGRIITKAGLENSAKKLQEAIIESTKNELKNE